MAVWRSSRAYLLVGKCRMAEVGQQKSITSCQLPHSTWLSSEARRSEVCIVFFCDGSRRLGQVSRRTFGSLVFENWFSLVDDLGRHV